MVIPTELTLVLPMTGYILNVNADPVNLQLKRFTLAAAAQSYIPSLNAEDR